MPASAELRRYSLEERREIIFEMARELGNRYGLFVPGIHVENHIAGVDLGKGLCLRRDGYCEIKVGENRYMGASGDSYKHETTHAIHLWNNPLYFNKQDSLEEIVATMGMNPQGDWDSLIKIAKENSVERIGFEAVANYFALEGLVPKIEDPIRANIGTIKNIEREILIYLPNLRADNPSDVPRFVAGVQALVYAGQYLGNHVGKVLAKNRNRISNELALFMMPPNDFASIVNSAYNNSKRDKVFENHLVNAVNKFHLS